MNTVRGSCDQPVAVEARRTVKKPKKGDRRISSAKKMVRPSNSILKPSPIGAFQPADTPGLAEQQGASTTAVEIPIADRVGEARPAERPQAPAPAPENAPAAGKASGHTAIAPAVGGTTAEQQQRTTGPGGGLQPLHTSTAHQGDNLAPDSQRKLDSPPDVGVRPRHRVLIIEDDPIMRMLLKRGLSSFDFDCLLTENGRAAQEILQKDHPDVLLVDLLMPVMDGLAFIKWLRQTAHDSTPVVVFTTVDNMKVREEVLRSGADYFASKPLHLKELAETMKNLIASRRTNQ